jgi:hypothetical protein
VASLFKLATTICFYKQWFVSALIDEANTMQAAANRNVAGSWAN